MDFQYLPLVRESINIIEAHQMRLWMESLQKFAPRLVILLGQCSLYKEGSVLIVECGDRELALQLWRYHLKALAISGTIEGLVGAKIYWKNCNAPYRLNFARILHAQNSHLSNKNMITRLTKSHPNLIEADYEEICDYLKLWRSQGKIVTITSMISNRCLHVNDRVTAERGVLFLPSLWIGVNFMDLWRDSMSDYQQLIDRLNSSDSGGFIPGYEYNILRVDGSFARYHKDYYLVRDYLSEPCRISVANSADWELLRNAPTG
jgi:hypothetical protein